MLGSGLRGLMYRSGTAAETGCKQPGASSWGIRLKGLERWISMTLVTEGRQLKRGKSEFLLLGPFTLGWICVHLVAAHRGTQGLPVGVANSGGLCAETT